MTYLSSCDVGKVCVLELSEDPAQSEAVVEEQHGGLVSAPCGPRQPRAQHLQQPQHALRLPRQQVRHQAGKRDTRAGAGKDTSSKTITRRALKT